ncbi:hypothetical protein ACFOYW_15330 [Gryllotalpicola reticulitermitis]|uniref:Uncharacterized protein n=1 Tax=Gryllotalpicola reticulitermitis TaxID=1184153 RepID=A0ABV8QB43_9MICO
MPVAGDKRAAGRGASPYQRIRHALGYLESAVALHHSSPHLAVDMLEQAVTQLVKARNQLVDVPIAPPGVPFAAETVQSAPLFYDKPWFPARRSR